MYEIFDDFWHFYMLYLVRNMFFEILIALISGLIFVASQVDEQELKQFCHHSEQFVVELPVKFVVELIIRCFL